MFKKQKAISIIMILSIITSLFCGCNNGKENDIMSSKLDKSKIYGVQFNYEDENPACTRIADSENLQNDYLIGENFKNGGKNDFDNAYPFGEMRLCCVTVKDGKKTVIYEDENGFSRDGSAGNVMVEIPKFYTKRELEGKTERWYISGEKHQGFSLEPAFKNGEKELDCIYVGAYNSTKLENNIFSSNNKMPDVNKNILEFRSDYSAAGYGSYDAATMLALQKLMVVEMGSRNLKNELGGLVHFSYCSRVTETNKIIEAANNSVTIKKAARNGNLFVGAQIGLGKGKSLEDSIVKTVTDIKEQDGALVISYDGEDVSDKITAGEDAAYGIVQKNGLSDKLSYHTGRCDEPTPYANYYHHLLQAFKYRNIENVWGNVWEFVSGLKIKNLEYYYTFDTDKYSLNISNWNKLSYKSPAQPMLPDKDDSSAYIGEFGLDTDSPLVMLPAVSGGGTVENKFGGVFYAYDDKDYEGNPVEKGKTYTYAAGAGFDHTWGSLFTVRGFLSDMSANWLYGNRIVLR